MGRYTTRGQRRTINIIRETRLGTMSTLGQTIAETKKKTRGQIAFEYDLTEGCVSLSRVKENGGLGID